MCEAKPGTRCAADTCTDAQVSLERYVATRGDGPAVDPLSARQAEFEAAPVETHITVPDPEYPHDMPLYEGPAHQAAEMLMGGTYEAVDFNDDTGQTRYRLTIPGDDGSESEAASCSYCAGSHGDMSPCNLPGASSTSISGEWAPGVTVKAVTFPDSKQGFGEPVYWVTAQDIKRLQGADFATKEEFDLGNQDSYLYESDNGEIVECYRDGDGRDDYEFRALECRYHNGVPHFALEGYVFDASPQ